MLKGCFGYVGLPVVGGTVKSGNRRSISKLKCLVFQSNVTLHTLQYFVFFGRFQFNINFQ